MKPARSIKRLAVAIAAATAVSASASNLFSDNVGATLENVDAEASSPVTAAAFRPSTKQYFHHVATIDVLEMNGSSVAEINDVNKGGNLLAYTDAENGEIGLVNIGNFNKLRGLGTVDMMGEPTSLAFTPQNLILVAVNTSESYTNPSGKLKIVGPNKKAVLREIDLPGQPDSVAVSADGRYAAIVIENERDEDLDDGLLPQNATGTVMILDMVGGYGKWSLREADLSPVAAHAMYGTDLEPEYVSINSKNQAVVSFQENNHFAVIDLESGGVVSEFSGGTVELWNVDSEEEDLINFNTDLTKRREADSVAWLDDDSFVSANEGDYEDKDGEEGGSRGFTIFNTDGTVEFESYESYEYIGGMIGHYNEGRSENKGVEPEGAAGGTIRGRKLAFVASERSNYIVIYDVTAGTEKPEFVQVLPTGIGPEGLKVHPGRGMLTVSNEVGDLSGDGIPATINIYRMKNKDPIYPMIVSDLDEETSTPIPWVALSGLAADPTEANTLYAVSDSFLAKGFIYTIDASETPAVINKRVEVQADNLDLEGVAIGPDGNFWLGSEGKADGNRANQILHVVKDTGAVAKTIDLPVELESNARKNGIEGIAVTGEAGAEMIYVAIQRAWPDTGDIDKEQTRILRYNVAKKEWTFVYYPLEAEGNGGWIGLSELTVLPNGNFAVIERDKGWGDSTAPYAELKAVYEIDLANADFRVINHPNPVTIEKELLVDVLPHIRANSVFTAEKLEGFAVDANGTMFAVTDNDGVDDAPGETVFLSLGQFK